jgi:hypothetical protein
MLKDKRTQGLLLAISLTCSIFAQTSTNSPYSRFGLGQLNPQGFDKGRAMGGIGLGLRVSNQLNYINPASYSAIDTMSSVFDFGVMGTYTTLESPDLSSTYFSSNLDHFAMGIPITKWWSASVGILPYSKVGYAVKEEVNDPNVGFIDYFYTGNGGLNQLYLGTALEFFNTISIGVNFKYLFGYIDIDHSIDFPLEETYGFPEINSQTNINDFLINLGLQYHQQIGEKFKLTMGVIFDNETQLSAEKSVIKSNTFAGNPVALTDSTILNPVFILEEYTQKGTIVIPMNIGAGLSLEYDDRLLLGFDYYQQDWTKAVFFGQKEPLTRQNSFHGGLQFTPNPRALRGYYNLISLRAGGHYTNSYLLIHGEQLKDYGISFGVGLPLRGGKSSFNLAFELGSRGSLENNLILENYKFVSFSITLHDIWFYKRKFD